jgi:L-fuconate dehydratase
MLEFADHLHEHFVDPIATRNGRYVAPVSPGFSIEMHAASLDAMEFPMGSEWTKA